MVTWRLITQRSVIPSHTNSLLVLNRLLFRLLRSRCLRRPVFSPQCSRCSNPRRNIIFSRRVTRPAHRRSPRWGGRRIETWMSSRSATRSRRLRRRSKVHIGLHCLSAPLCGRTLMATRNRSWPRQLSNFGAFGLAMLPLLVVFASWGHRGPVAPWHWHDRPPWSQFFLAPAA